MIPGDPARVLAGTDADAAGLEEIREKYGLNDPLPLQYLRWIGLAAARRPRRVHPHARVGGVDGRAPSCRSRSSWRACRCWSRWPSPSRPACSRRCAATRAWDLLASGVSLCGVSVPNFWLGIMLILFVSVRLGWLPASGFVPLCEDPLGNLKRMLMPALVLGTGLAAVLMRQTRNSMIEVLSADYVRTARARGWPSRAVVVRHALRNGLIPVVTILGLQMGALMSGAVVTEQIFVLPGFGRLIVEAVFTRDYPLVQGVVLITASSYVLINLLVDVSYSVLNPRIRIRGAADGG